MSSPHATIRYPTTNERQEMIATATALIEAVSDAIMDDESMMIAKELLNNRNTDTETFAKALYLYSGMIATVAIDKATKILLTDTELINLMETIGEMEALRNEVISGK